MVQDRDISSKSLILQIQHSEAQEYMDDIEIQVRIYNPNFQGHIPPRVYHASAVVHDSVIYTFGGMKDSNMYKLRRKLRDQCELYKFPVLLIDSQMDKEKKFYEEDESEDVEEETKFEELLIEHKTEDMIPQV